MSTIRFPQRNLSPEANNWARTVEVNLQELKQLSIELQQASQRALRDSSYALEADTRLSDSLSETNNVLGVQEGKIDEASSSSQDALDILSRSTFWETYPPTEVPDTFGGTQDEDGGIYEESGTYEFVPDQNNVTWYVVSSVGDIREIWHYTLSSTDSGSEEDSGSGGVWTRYGLSQIGSSDNLAPPTSLFPEAWSPGSSSRLTSLQADPFKGGIEIDIDGPTVASRSVYGPFVQIFPGQPISFNAYATYWSGRSPEGVNWSTHLYWYDGDKQPLSPERTAITTEASSGGVGTGWSRGRVRAPDDAYFVRARFYSDFGVDDNPRLFRSFSIYPESGNTVVIEGVAYPRTGTVSVPGVDLSTSISGGSLYRSGQVPIPIGITPPNGWRWIITGWMGAPGWVSFYGGSRTDTPTVTAYNASESLDRTIFASYQLVPDV